MNKAVESLTSVFRDRGILLSSDDFNVEPLRDARHRVTLSASVRQTVANLRSSTGGGNPRPLLNQVVALIHFSSEAPPALVTLDLDTGSLRDGNNVIGNGGWEVAAIDPVHPYSKKSLLANWFGGVGFAIYFDSVPLWFPGIVSLSVAIESLDIPLDFTLEIIKGGNNQHSSGDVVNATGSILQTFSDSTAKTLVYTFATQTAALT